MSDRDLMELFDTNGNVIGSSQLRFDSDDTSRHVYGCMEGIIVSVKPSDDQDNSSSANANDKRGFRHECVVLIVDADGEPNLLLEHVVIPPRQHSGIDDYEEDLPRGVLTHLDKQTISENWKHLDISRLDGEHCVVSFMSGCIDKPFISNWWPHPANKFDPATTGQACLAQVDANKNLSRSMRRVNGVLQMVTKDGDLYLSTNEASSTVEITPKYRRQLKDKGGSLQVDIKKTQQLEINWNVPVEGLKAGSTSAAQSRDVDLPHIDHAKALAAMTPDKRETTRTFLRHKQYEMLEKTSNWTVWCEDTSSESGKKGEATLLADNSVNIYVRPGSGPATTISINDGKIQIINSDGSLINVLNDAIHVVTKSGGRISVEGKNVTVAGKMDISGPVAIANGPDPVINATTYQLAESLVIGPLGAYLLAAAAAWKAVGAIVPPPAKLLTDAASAAATTATPLATAFAGELAKGMKSPFATKNLTSS